MKRKRNTARVLVVSDDEKSALGVLHHGDPERIGLPGGGLRSGEMPREAAERELYEETGLRAARMRLVAFLRDASGSFSAVFYAEGVSGRLRDSKEGPVVWAPLKVFESGKHGAYYRKLFHHIATREERVAKGMTDEQFQAALDIVSGKTKTGEETQAALDVYHGKVHSVRHG